MLEWHKEDSFLWIKGFLFTKWEVVQVDAPLATTNIGKLSIFIVENLYIYVFPKLIEWLVPIVTLKDLGDPSEKLTCIWIDPNNI